MNQNIGTMYAAPKTGGRSCGRAASFRDIVFPGICLILTLTLVTFVTLLLVQTFAVSPRELGRLLFAPTLWPIIGVSLKTSFLAASLALLTGTPVAYLLARKPFLGKAVIETLLDLPVALPPMVCGLALLMLVSPTTPSGRLLAAADIRLVFTPAGIVLAQYLVALPLLIRAARSAFSAIPAMLPAAAAVLRASEGYTFFHVMLPLSREGLTSGFILCWTRALGEFGATAMIAGCIPGLTETLPVAIYTRATTGDFAAAGAASFCLATLSFSALIVLRMFIRDDRRLRKA